MLTAAIERNACCLRAIALGIVIRCVHWSICCNDDLAGSQSGTVALPMFAPYACSKFGVEALSDCLRVELAGQVSTCSCHILSFWRLTNKGVILALLSDCLRCGAGTMRITFSGSIRK